MRDAAVGLAAPLGDLLRSGGAQIEAEAGGAIVVRDRTLEEIGRTVAERRLVITELQPLASSLEEIYLELTGNPNGGPS